MASSFGSNASTGVPEIKHGLNTVITANQLTSKAIFPTGVVRATGTGMPVVYEQVLGIGQTWQDVTASRAVGVTYTNNTEKPIFVLANINITVLGGSAILTIDSLTSGSTIHSYSQWLSFIVPKGGTYKLSGSILIMNFLELR